MDFSRTDDSPAAATSQPQRVPDRIILVYGGDSGLGPLLLDVVKKVVGQEDCPLCQITHHPLGKRGAWRACEAQLGIPVSVLHRNDLPAAWELQEHWLPCILAQSRNESPIRIVSRDEVATCKGEVAALERCLQAGLTRFGGYQ